MRVIDVLDKVNIEELTENLIQNHSSNFTNKEKTMKILKKFYEDIHSIKLEDVSSLEEYHDFTVIVNTIYDDNTLDGESIFDIAEKNRDIKFDFESISVDCLNKYFIVDGLNLSELIEKKDNIILDFKEYLKLPSDEFQKHYVTSYGLDFIPRSIILACEVADLSIKRFGLLNCATEIFWELTFYGLTEEQVQTEASKLNDRTNDSSESVEFDLDEEFEIDKRDIEFATEFSKKVNEFSHRMIHEFYLEMAKSLS